MAAMACAILRWLGVMLLAAAFCTFVLDGTRVIAGGPLAASSLGQVVGALVFAGSPLSDAGPWRDFDARILAVPAVAAFGIAGLFLMYAGRRRVARRRT